MAKFDFYAGNLPEKDVLAMRQQVDSHVFYWVVETKDVADADYDPIYGEAYESFGSGVASSATYIPFQASIIRRSRDSDMFRQGFKSQEKLLIDVSNTLPWLAGMLIMFEGTNYRISDVDARGLDFVDRFILYLDEVT